MINKRYTYFFFILLFIPKKGVCAYIDPGSGSYLFQIILAALISIPFVFTGKVNKLKSFIRVKIDKLKNFFKHEKQN